MNLIPQYLIKRNADFLDGFAFLSHCSGGTYSNGEGPPFLFRGGAEDPPSTFNNDRLFKATFVQLFELCPSKTEKNIFNYLFIFGCYIVN